MNTVTKLFTALTATSTACIIYVHAGEPLEAVVGSTCNVFALAAMKLLHQSIEPGVWEDEDQTGQPERLENNNSSSISEGPS
jgi:hypothetical protein